jgi:hypothetical protein
MTLFARLVSQDTTRRVRSDTLKGPFEVLTHVFHNLGIQSNVVVSAKYSHKSEVLSPAIVFRALREVLKEHPTLSIIGVAQPSEKKKGNHRLWEVRLPVINLQDCVEFVDTPNDGDDNLARQYEAIHNQWFDTANISKPWWKLLVVKGSHVFFIYHHSIGDGLSGYAFHRSLLAAINTSSVESAKSQVEAPNFKVEVSHEMPWPCPLDKINERLSWSLVVYTMLTWVFIRTFINQKYFLFSDAVISKTYPTATKPFPPSQKTTTKVKLLRIDKATMKKCIDACRKYNTSFTALLHTLVQVALATDIYPNAKLGFSRVAVNIRSLLPVDPGPDVFTNAVSAYYAIQFLGNYRKAGVRAFSTQAETSETPNDLSLVWNLAVGYKKGLNAFSKSGAAIQDFLIGRLLGEDDEEVGQFTGFGMVMNNSFLISNLGVFEPKENMTAGGWTIEDVGFSAGAIRSAISECGIIFNVASVKDGDCVIFATYEEGVLKEDMVTRVLDLVSQRMKFVGLN